MTDVTANLVAALVFPNGGLRLRNPGCASDVVMSVPEGDVRLGDVKSIYERMLTQMLDDELDEYMAQGDNMLHHCGSRIVGSAQT